MSVLVKVIVTISTTTLILGLLSLRNSTDYDPVSFPTDLFVSQAGLCLAGPLSMPSWVYFPPDMVCPSPALEGQSVWSPISLIPSLLIILFVILRVNRILAHFVIARISSWNAVSEDIFILRTLAKTIGSDTVFRLRSIRESYGFEFRTKSSSHSFLSPYGVHLSQAKILCCSVVLSIAPLEYSLFSSRWMELSFPNAADLSHRRDLNFHRQCRNLLRLRYWNIFNP